MRTPRGRTTTSFAVLIVLVVVIAATTLAWVAVGTKAADAIVPSVTIPCSHGTTPIDVTVSSNLDPTCTYTGGFRITASDVDFDCRGATIDDPSGTGTLGIEITAPTTTALSGITVHDCTVRGFGNSIHIDRQGFRQLAAGVEYDHAFSDIVIERVDVADSRGVAIYIDAYVTDVTVRDSLLHRAGSTGVYLEEGSKDNTIDGNRFAGNGFLENGAGGTTAVLGGQTYRFWGPGREALAVDGSRHNRIVDNTFVANSAGGIFLYTNCGEGYTTEPASWLDHRYGADDNVIEGNRFENEKIGVWVGSRMSENTYPMDCSDPAYVTAVFRRVVLDRAPRNVVRSNTFSDVSYGVHVEDDHTTVDANRFDGPDGLHHAIIIGTKARTSVLHRPVTSTVVTDNVSTIVGNPSPYRWIYGESDTTFTGNQVLGNPGSLCQGQPIPINPLIMVIAAKIQDPNGPIPPTPDLTFKPIGPLPPCPGDPITTTTSSTTSSTSTSTSTSTPSSISSSTSSPTSSTVPPAAALPSAPAAEAVAATPVLTG